MNTGVTQKNSKEGQKNQKKCHNEHNEIEQIINIFILLLLVFGARVPHAEQIICFHLAHFLQCFVG